MDNKLEKLFYEVLEKYRESESKNNDKLLGVGLMSYQIAEKGLKDEIEEYKTRFKKIINE